MFQTNRYQQDLYLDNMDEVLAARRLAGGTSFSHTGARKLALMWRAGVGGLG